MSNSGYSYLGPISLRRAVQKSSNVATYRLYQELGPEECLKYLENLNFAGLEPEDYEYDTTCLGGFTKGTTAVEMAAGYATLANDGKYRTPTCIVRITDADGNVIRLKREELNLGYRTSIVKEKGYIVLEAVIRLNKGEASHIKEQMDDFKERRTSKQPLDMPSAGSTFKRPEGYFAGKLIMDTGLRGFQVGGAQISEKHCGFVVNTGDATAEDVKNLIEEVQKRVREKFGVTLEPEVKFLGEF